MAARIYRYRVLLARRWWVLLLTMSAVVFLEAIVLKNQPETFVSNARLWVSTGMSIPGGTGNAESATPNFIPTQIELLQSPNILKRARARLQTLKPDLAEIRVRLDVVHSPRTDFILLKTSGSEPKFVQAYLDAVVEEYLEYRKEVRTTTVDANLQKLTDQLTSREKDLKETVSKLDKFKQEKARDLLTDTSGMSEIQFNKLKAELSALLFESELLERLTPDQQIEKASSLSLIGLGANPSAAGAESSLRSVDYTRLRQQFQVLTDNKADLSQYLKPAHPKMIVLEEQIQRLSRQMATIREDAAQQLASYRATLKTRIKTLEDNIQSTEARALESKQRMTEYESLKQGVERARAAYDRLLDIVQQVGFSTRVSQESVQIEQRATDALFAERNLPKSLALGAIVGLMLGFAVLFLMDRFDDRLNTTSELTDRINEPLLGQVPEQIGVSKDAALKLLDADDERHAFAEAYRNVRSSLLFLDTGDFKPKSFVITSAIPSEGKSTVSANFALTMANAGHRVLLIDADLRRGELHTRFQVPNGPGLTELLRKQTDYAAVIRGTAVANLFLLPRGKASNRASELFLGSAMDAFLEKAEAEFDYVVFDTAPILATDDTATLAPKIDGTLFVVRASFTSSKMSRSAIDQLHRRGVNVLGVIFNRISESMPDYHYYKYTEYYAAKPDTE